jgi:hypothetical protein
MAHRASPDVLDRASSTRKPGDIQEKINADLLDLNPKARIQHWKFLQL